MKVDATTPIGDLLAAVAYDAVLPADMAAQNAARAELARRSELAAKYERLTRALAMMVTGGSKKIQLHHDGTPDGIADAYIAAAEAAQ